MSSFNINNYTENLTEKDGIFFSKNINEISYPVGGHDVCFSLEDNSFWFKHRNNCVISLVKRYAKDKPFFDIGGGNGFVSKGLEENEIQTCLVEPGIQGCLNAKKRGLTNIVCSDLENVGFKAGSIPSVGLFDVIEHIENDIDFLSKVNSILTDADGYAFITVPAYQFLWSKEDSEAGHFRRYTLRNFRKRLNRSGFEMVYSTYIFSFLVLPILFFRTLPNLFGFAKSTVEKTQKEHNVNEGGFTNKLLTRLLQFEVKQIENNKKILFGGSCLVVAKKK